MENMMYDWACGAKSLMKTVLETPAFIRSSFLMKGQSPEMVRKVAVEVATLLQKEGRIPYTGVIPSFALRVPAFSTGEGAGRALDALMSSVECAAGYYSIFQGSIILELDKSWIGINDLDALGEYLNYIQVNRENICFIILLPAKASKKLEEYILQYSVFHAIEIPEPTPEQLATMFRLVANERGFSLSEDAESSLPEKTEAVLAVGGNYPLIVEHMVEKAAYFHVADGNMDRTLQARDIDRLFVPGSVICEKPKRQIGFARGG